MYLALILAGTLGLSGMRESRKPLRIVSLMPSNTEVAFDLGAGSELVGITTFCDYPPETAKVEKVGDFIHPNIEKILALKPDVVLAGQWSSTSIADRLRKLGLKVVEIKLPATLEQIYETINDVALAINREKEAKTVVADLKARVEKIEQKARDRKYQPKVFIHVDDPNWTVSKLSFISDAVERCGTVNIFRDLPAAGAQVSMEALIKEDPEVIILTRKAREEITSQAGWKRVNAVKNNHIVTDTGKDCLTRPTPRIVLGMEKLTDALSGMSFAGTPLK